MTDNQAANVLLTMQMGDDEDLSLKDRTNALSKALEWFIRISNIKENLNNFVGSNPKRETVNSKKNS